VRNPDVLAPRFVAWGVRLPALVKVPGCDGSSRVLAEAKDPGSYYFETARTRHLDVRRAVRVERGNLAARTFLGAGYDSRAYRMADRAAGCRGVRGRLPAMSAIQAPEGETDRRGPAANVRYVEIDFTREDLGERLAARANDPSAATLFVWSGVAPYLPEEAVREVLGFVAAQGSPDTSIVFDYCFREVVEGDDAYYGAPELLARLAEMGEPLRSGHPAWADGQYLADLGLRLEEDLGRRTRSTLPDSLGRQRVRAPMGFGGLAHGARGRLAAALSRLDLRAGTMSSRPSGQRTQALWPPS
jgi:methyltransferase (TIGR00027 family)